MTEGQEFDLVPASGTGSDAFSSADLFYLTHHELIEVWANLQADAVAARNHWLEVNVAPEIAKIAASRGLVPAATRDPRWRAHLMVVDDTPLSDAGPVVGIGLGWSESTLEPPYVGFFVDTTAGYAQVIEDAFRSGRGYEIQQAHGYRTETGSPAWRPVELGARWWEDLDATIALIKQEVEQVAARFDGPLRAAAQAARSAI